MKCFKKLHSAGSNILFGDNPSEEHMLLITGGGERRLVYMLIVKGYTDLTSMFLE